MLPCLLCSKETRKYKCSNCLEFCCSFECYKEHKTNDLCLKPENLEINQDKLADEQEPTQHVFKSYDTIAPAVLERLKTADNVKNLLYNSHLRKLLRDLDTATNAGKAMEFAMQEPLFIEFADECLKVVEPENEKL